MSATSKLSVKSSWTPLSREDTNHKIFEERRLLVQKWFDKWTDEQRKLVISDLVSKCKNKQLEYAGELIQRKKPVVRGDPTSALPRVVSLYIFSFLDPRSLSRCAQVLIMTYMDVTEHFDETNERLNVSWHWKAATELDQLWMPKCVRLGWLLTFAPSPYEVGVWKRLYIENIMMLKALAPRKSDVSLRDVEGLGGSTHDTSRKSTARSLRPGSSGGKPKLPPWRGTDPNPKDMWRNNVLENEDDKERVDKLHKKLAARRKKHLYGPLSEDIMRKARTKVRTGEHAAMVREIHERQKSGGRPQWARQNGGGGAPFVSPTLTDASQRPAPVTSPPRPAPRPKQTRPITDYGAISTTAWQQPDGEDSDT